MLSNRWKIFSFMVVAVIAGLSFSVYAATTTPTAPVSVTTTPATSAPAVAATNSGNVLVGGLILEKDNYSVVFGQPVAGWRVFGGGGRL